MRATQLSWSRPFPQRGNVCCARPNQERLQVLPASTYPICFTFLLLFCASPSLSNPQKTLQCLHTGEMME